MRLWVNKARTVLVSEMDDGNLTVALRNEEGEIWGPPILCVPEDDSPLLTPLQAHLRSTGWHRESRA
jgi:hypothetical protein